MKLNIPEESKKLEDMIVQLQIKFRETLLNEAYSKALEIYTVDKDLGYKYVTILNRYWGER